MMVHFTHPTRSEVYHADVAPECTGATAVKGLIDANFLEPPGKFSYDLTLDRTSATIGPNATLASCGLQEGDVVSVLRRGSGAH